MYNSRKALNMRENSKRDGQKRPQKTESTVRED
nr:MAG TPA: hypothetical protein [Caudoviricetes sp.]